MLIEHNGARPVVHPTAYVAPNAVVSGNVEIGPECRVLFGAVLTDDGGAVRLGSRVTVMENAVVRGRSRFPTSVGDDSLIGPHAHLNGTRIGGRVFIATGAALFPGSVVGDRAVVRVHGIVQVNTHLPADGLVPIGWVALGNPAKILSPDRHDEISRELASLNFRGTVYGVDPEFDADSDGSVMPAIAERYADLFGTHRRDTVIE